ncbi:HAD-IIIC family phosphatase [Actinokineospora sp. NPDC004072]
MRPGVKCVIWDLDDTLWQGTLLEGDELVLTPGIVPIVAELDRRGILQSVASKNEFAPAWERLTAFGLAEYFLHPQIGWASKSTSVKAIVERLGIGADTVVFVDDQPFERDEVRFALPQVRVVDAADIGGLLAADGMRPRFITDESALRRRIYQSDIRRDEQAAAFPGTSAEFLATLDMRLRIRRAGELDLRRAEELTVRTNQLNTTGRTYSYDELRRLSTSPDHLLVVADLRDRYGTSGTVGLALIKRDPGTWLVQLFIMSCRVISRGVGGIMINHILAQAERAGVRLLADFVTTGRNRMMYITYKFHGFREIAADGDTLLLEHDLRTIRPSPPHVRVEADWG